jgi:crossover junction endodeoxyribonuclease RuvC
MSSESRVILGIDPGTQVFGWGVVVVSRGRASYKAMGVTSLKKYKSHFEKLAAIYSSVESLIVKYRPDELAVEAPFYGKNVQSMLKLGRAQGAAIAAALRVKVPVFEYAPRRIKQSITGMGAASKHQVASVISSILGVDDIPESFDATDGLAVALCHFLSMDISPDMRESKSSSGSSSSGSKWSAFVKNNPGRVK